jgi:hypothetical protein
MTCLTYSGSLIGPFLSNLSPEYLAVVNLLGAGSNKAVESDDMVNGLDGHYCLALSSGDMFHNRKLGIVLGANTATFGQYLPIKHSETLTK